MNNKKYTVQIALSFVVSLALTSVKHFKLIPHSTWLPSVHEYRNLESFFLSFFVLGTILSIGIIFLNRDKNRENHLICPSCESLDVVKDVKCKNCDVTMVRLKNFYERKNK